VKTDDRRAELLLGDTEIALDRLGLRAPGGAERRRALRCNRAGGPEGAIGGDLVGQDRVGAARGDHHHRSIGTEPDLRSSASLGNACAPPATDCIPVDAQPERR
jgi:hypothetical protein